PQVHPGVSGMEQRRQFLGWDAYCDEAEVRVENRAQGRDGVLPRQGGLWRCFLTRLDALHDEVAVALVQPDDPGAGHFVDEVRERACAEVPLGKRRVQLQHGALEQPQLRCHLPPFKRLQRPLHQRQSLFQRQRFSAPPGRLLMLLPAAAMRRTRRPYIEQGLIADELVAIPLQNGAREGLAAYDEDPLVVLLELLD